MDWKPVPTFAFVEASSTGLIRTVGHRTLTVQKHRTFYQHRTGKVLTPIAQKSGHLFVNLPAPEGYGHNQRPQYVHRLVCMAFHGLPPEDKPLACHKDDDPSNNAEDNLYWGSASDNKKDAMKNAKVSKGAAHHKTTLTDEQVAQIRASYKPRSKEFGAQALGLKYGVHRTTIENIVSGRTWN